MLITIKIFAMGVYLCTIEEYGDIYEIRTPGQGAVYLVLAVIYIALESYCIIETIKICKTQKSIMKNKVLIAAHTCIHILFIRDIIFMPGGALICYEKTFYSCIATMLYIIKHIIILVMLYQILCILLDSYTIPNRKRYLKRVIIVVIIVDVCLHLMFFFISLFVEGKYSKVPRDMYSIIDAAVIMFIFNYFMVQFKKFLKRMNKFVPDSGDYRATILLSISINCCFCARIIYKILANITNLSGALDFKKEFGYGIYMAIYYSLNEMFPCIMIFHAMKKGGKEHYMKLDVMFRVNSKRNLTKK